MFMKHTIQGLFLDILKKNSNSEKLKTRAKSGKNSDQISKKLKICQLHLSSVARMVTKVRKKWFSKLLVQNVNLNNLRNKFFSYAFSINHDVFFTHKNSVE